MNNSNKNNKFNYLKTFDQLSKSGAIIIGLIYVFGLLITNMHLGYYGIYDFSILRVRYTFAGFSFLLFLFSPALIIITAIIAYRSSMLAPKESYIRSIIRNDKIFRILSFIIAILLSFLVLFVLTHFLSVLILGSPRNYDFNNMFPLVGVVYGSFNLLWIIFLGILYIVIYLTIKSEKDKEFSKYEMIPIYVVIVFLLIMCIFIYSGNLHPKVHSLFGGGRPISSDILISNDGIPIIISLGLKLDKERYIRQAQIIHETSSRIYLLPIKKNAKRIKSIALSIKCIEGINYLSESSEMEYKKTEERDKESKL